MSTLPSKMPRLLMAFTVTAVIASHATTSAL
jgi:hypothetical protein